MPDEPDATWASPWRPTSRRGRWERRLLGLRRAVLRRRRVLAAALTAVAVLAVLRTVAPPPPATVAVLVAARDLSSGTLVSGDDVAEVGYRPATVPDGLAVDPVGRTLAAPVRRGEPLTDVRLVGPRLTDGYDAATDLVAIPVRLPDAGSVALLAVGDRIDLLATDPSVGDARLVAASVPVLAVPQFDDAASGAVTGRLVVLGAPPATAEVVAGAAVRDFLSFTFAR
jgi:Flp pilus assembly protein CpaB